MITLKFPTQIAEQLFINEIKHRNLEIICENPVEFAQKSDLDKIGLVYDEAHREIRAKDTKKSCEEILELLKSAYKGKDLQLGTKVNEVYFKIVTSTKSLSVTLSYKGFKSEKMG